MRKHNPPKPCANLDCQKLFIARRTTDKYCCYDCAKKTKKPIRRGKAKHGDPNNPKKKVKGHKSLAKWVKELETHFNRFIRERDWKAGHGCISCGKALLKSETGAAQFDAGHFWPVSNYKGIRFHEDNVHGQCKGCNGYKGGNVGEYRIALLLRIGIERVMHLETIRHTVFKMTVPEIQEQIAIYKKKLENL